MAGVAGGPRSYELTRNPRPWASAAIAVASTATGVGALVDDAGDPAVAVVLALVGGLMVVNAGWILLRWPDRVTVTPDGLRFRAMTYDRFVPWVDVVSVRVSRGRFGGGIRWRFARKPHVTSAATFEHQHRLLADVEGHAPHVKLVA